MLDLTLEKREGQDCWNIFNSSKTLNMKNWDSIHHQNLPTHFYLTMLILMKRFLYWTKEDIFELFGINREHQITLIIENSN